MPPRETDGDAPPDRIYRFGDIVVDGPAHSLSRAGVEVPVEPKAFAVLLALLQRPGELLARDALIDEVWGHHHVTPGVLTRVIAQLRHALGDDPHHARFIQTQHALGYRFIGTLLPDDDEASAGGAQPADGDDKAPDRPTQERRQARLPEPAMLALPAANEQSPVAADARPPRARWPWRARSPRWLAPRRRPWLVGTGLVLVLAMAWLWTRAPVGPGRPQEASIAVLPVTRVGGGADDAYFADGLAIELLDALAGVPGLKVAARTRGLDGDADPRRVGRTLGVASVLDLHVRRAGKRVRINARLIDTASGFTAWSESYDRELSDVFEVQTEIAQHVVRALLGVLPEDDALARRLAPTRDIAAFDAYLRGLHAGGSGRDADRAIAFFRTALKADASFALAQAGICREEIRRLESNRDAARFDLAQDACTAARRLGPGLQAVDLAFGDLYRVQGRHEAAVEQYNKAQADPALRAAAFIGLGRVEAARNRAALARAFFRRAIALRPGDGAAYRELGYQHYVDGEFAQAAAAYRTAASLQPDDSGVWSSLGGIYLAAGDRRRAVEAFDRSLKIKPNYGALSNLGTLEFEGGRHARAAVLYRQAAEFMPDDFRTWANLADALVAQPKRAVEARQAFARAAELARSYVEVSPGDADARAQLAWIEANLDRPVRARQLVAEAEAIGSQPGEVALWAAQAFARMGDGESARTRVQAARANGASEQRIRSLPWLSQVLARDASTASPPERVDAPGPGPTAR